MILRYSCCINPHPIYITLWESVEVKNFSTKAPLAYNTTNYTLDIKVSTQMFVVFPEPLNSCSLHVVLPHHRETHRYQSG